MITVIANGKPKELPGEMSVSRFLALGSIPAPIVVVELCGEIVRRHDYDSTIIRQGDRIEVVRMMGGG
ncbi:MAG: sulfur carrier protein ThiS [Dehalococcoidia bacterium]|nr:sulfur carrier protein ThiS [Dehalococcoidia bacterium]